MPTDTEAPIWELQSLSADPPPSPRALKRARTRGRRLSGEEMDRRDATETVEVALTLAVTKATRAIDVNRGFVFFEPWAQLVRTHLRGARVSNETLARQWQGIAVRQLSERLMLAYSPYGRCTATGSFWRGQPCVRAFLAVPVSKLDLGSDDVHSRRYFDE